MEAGPVDRHVLSRYHVLAILLVALNAAEAIGVTSFSADGLAWTNLAGAGIMAVLWLTHEWMEGRRRAMRARRELRRSRTTPPLSP